MARGDALIEQLKTGDYYSRSTAARALAQIGGERAENALIEALKDEDDWVREYAAESLGKLRCRRAIGPLGELLKSGNYKVRSSVAEALGRIGGDDARRLLEPLASESDSWVREAVLTALNRVSGKETLGDSERFSLAADDARKVESEPELSMDETTDELQHEVAALSSGSAGRTYLTPHELIQAITEDTSIQFRKMKSGYLLRVPVGGSRSQKVRLKFGSTDEDGSPIIQIFTVVAPAKAEYYQWVLKLNPTFSYGAIGIVKIDGKEFFALTNTLLEEKIDTRAIEKSVRILAEKGDALEQKLIHKDVW
jgi:hypothetical protein